MPKADAKEKVKRFQGLGVYVNKDCLKDATNNVFVNIFPTGKCTVTAANSRPQVTFVCVCVRACVRAPIALCHFMCIHAYIRSMNLRMQ